MKGPIKRRDFIKYLGAGLAGPAFRNLFHFKKAAVAHLNPYVELPEGVIPGLPTWYATVCRQCEAGCGIHVKLLEGRAKKIEGHPDFPVNYGKTCARGQAGLQVLYNPDRIRTPLAKKDGKFEPVSWKKAISIAAARLADIKEEGESDKVVILTQPLRGTLAGLFTAFAQSYGTEKIFSYEPLKDFGLEKANSLSFGSDRFPHYDIANALYVLSFGAPLLDTWASPVKHSVAFGKMRDTTKRPSEKRGRLIQFEPRLTVTGASADEWHPIKPGTEGLLALAVANVIIEEKLYAKSIDGEAEQWREALEKYTPNAVAKQAGVSAKDIERVAREFAEHRPALAICGGTATAQENGTFNAVAANILNHLIGGIGGRGGVFFNAPSPFDGFREKSLTHEGLTEVIKDMASIETKALIIYNANPAFNAPRGSGFKKHVKNVGFVLSFSSFMDETTALADVVLPDHSFLESWGDYVPLVDSGRKTVGLLQPVVTPLYKTKLVGDSLLLLGRAIGGQTAAALPQGDFYGYLRDSWKTVYEANGSVIDYGTFDDFWQASVQRGGWWASNETQEAPAESPSPELISQAKPKPAEEDEEYEFNLLAYPSHSYYDGRHANLPWMQQWPEPLVTVAWGSWAEINPETAKELDVREGDVLEIETKRGKIAVPAYLYHGIEPKTVAVPIGLGHTDYGRYAAKRGVNPLEVVDPRANESNAGLNWAITRARVTKSDSHSALVKTEPPLDLPGMETGLREIERHIVQWISPDEFEKVEREQLAQIEALPTRDLRKGPHFLAGLGLGKYRESKFHDYKYRWGMVIDLDKCTGCSTCMVACYAENNLPLVDEVELAKHRHKNWIRLDRYWEGEYPKVRAKVMPVNCYQCGNAPCESVCPVYAAFHTKDGLNGQVYQRCAGTRYCNVNCPYRSRLFNFFNPEWPEPLDQQLSPELSVRTSGVTDKCSFCVQRIRYHKDIAKDEKRRVRDGEITPACAQACPTGAITFGDLLDHDSRVSELTGNPRRYRVFEKVFNTEPAVIYLKAIREGAEEEGGHGGSEAGAHPVSGGAGNTEAGEEHGKEEVKHE